MKYIAYSYRIYKYIREQNYFLQEGKLVPLHPTISINESIVEKLPLETYSKEAMVQENEYKKPYIFIYKGLSNKMAYLIGIAYKDTLIQIYFNRDTKVLSNEI
jgi:hypothetical protein